MFENPALERNNPEQEGSSLQNFSFEGFIFNVEADELFAENTQKIYKLEPQVSQLLSLFVQNKDQVLTKAFLQQELWPNTVVEQNSLYQVLAKLRKLLSDSSRAPKYIKTIPKKGYCFIAEVSSSSKSSAINSNKVKPSIVVSKWFIRYFPAVLFALLFLILLGYGVTNWSSQKEVQSHYELEDVSYQLGLEFDVSVHKTYDLMAYIKDLTSLHITNKQGKIIYEKTSDVRLAFPSWHPDNKKLAYWRYRENQCELFVITPQGAKSDQAPSLTCDIKSAPAMKPVWLNQEELMLTIKQAGDVKMYRYRLGSDSLTPVSLVLDSGVYPAGVINAWHGKSYYLLNRNNQTTSLVDFEGNEVLNWAFPVWLFAYDAVTEKIISNDSSQGKKLIATSLNGDSVEIIASVKGIFTSLSIDKQGDIYTAIEHWQVNIRDNNESALFSTSSIDYLTNSNILGETAFVSKRTGHYEVYLSSDKKLKQLSKHKSEQFIKFLEWRPDLSMLLSSRAGELAIYDKQSVILEISSTLPQDIKNIGWLDNGTFYAFDGNTVIIYDLLGQIVSEHKIKGLGLTYHQSQQRWLLFNHEGISTLSALTDEPHHLVALNDNQISTLKNIRIKQNKLYWQSTWSQQDKIWSLALDVNNKIVELVKEGQLIWHFDITDKGNIHVSKMESIEGDIKRLIASKP
jgi:DNA-binding winged helix-turn-helix (wHTH) protein